MFPWKKSTLCSPWRLPACRVPAATGTGCWRFVPSPTLCSLAAFVLSRLPRLPIPLPGQHLSHKPTTSNATGLATNSGSSASSWVATTPLSAKLTVLHVIEKLHSLNHGHAGEVLPEDAF